MAVLSVRVAVFAGLLMLVAIYILLPFPRHPEAHEPETGTGLDAPTVVLLTPRIALPPQPIISSDQPTVGSIIASPPEVSGQPMSSSTSVSAASVAVTTTSSSTVRASVGVSDTTAKSPATSMTSNPPAISPLSVPSPSSSAPTPAQDVSPARVSPPSFPSAPCSWHQTHTHAPDVKSPRARSILGLLHHVHHQWHRQLGYLYALTDGSYLGSWRHGGVIPGDDNLDLFLFLKDGQDRFQFRAEVLPSLPSRWELNDVSMAHKTAKKKRIAPNRGYLQLIDGVANVSANIEILTREKWQNSRLAPLCLCPFAPEQAICFEHAHLFLTMSYGPQFRGPSFVRTERQDLLWFFQIKG